MFIFFLTSRKELSIKHQVKVNIQNPLTHCGCLRLVTQTWGVSPRVQFHNPENSESGSGNSHWKQITHDNVCPVIPSVTMSYQRSWSRVCEFKPVWSKATDPIWYHRTIHSSSFSVEFLIKKRTVCHVNWTRPIFHRFRFSRLNESGLKESSGNRIQMMVRSVTHNTLYCNVGFPFHSDMGEPVQRKGS